MSGLVCPSCSGDVSAGGRFCRHCGVRLAVEARPKSEAAERKLATALAIDIQGSVRLSERVEAEKWHRIIGRYFGLLARGVRRFEGTVSRFTGDGIVAVFGAPVAQEDHAQRACLAAIHLTDELQGYAADLQHTHGITLTVRVGVHSGVVIVGTAGAATSEGTAVLGEAILIATAAEQLAAPGKIYVTSQTAQLVDADFVLRDLGSIRSHRLERPLELSELVGETKRPVGREVRGAETPMVGRAPELALLEESLGRAANRGEVVGVVGEGGVGKSRLCTEFLARSRRRGLRVQHWYALPHHRAVPFRALSDSIARFFGVREGADAGETIQRLRKILGQVDERGTRLVSVVLELLGWQERATAETAGEASRRGQELAELLEALVLAPETQLPDVMLIEDIHWVDEPSRHLLDRFIELVPKTKLLLLVNQRPDALLVAPSEAIALGPLDAVASDALLRDLLGSDRSVRDLIGDIRERTGGNPFFLRETVRALADEGVLVGSVGNYRLLGESDPSRLPATVQAALSARIDALADREKEVLNAAAVVGQRFSVGQVSETLGSDERTVSRAFATLERAHFIRSGTRTGDEWYEFEHPIIAEAARQSLFGSRRRALHRAAAAAGGGR